MYNTSEYYPVNRLDLTNPTDGDIVVDISVHCSNECLWFSFNKQFTSFHCVIRRNARKLGENETHFSIHIFVPHFTDHQQHRSTSHRRRHSRWSQVRTPPLRWLVIRWMLCWLLCARDVDGAEHQRVKSSSSEKKSPISLHHYRHHLDRSGKSSFAKSHTLPNQIIHQFSSHTGLKLVHPRDFALNENHSDLYVPINARQTFSYSLCFTGRLLQFHW